MRIVLALGNAADTGGPTKYAQQLKTQFERRNHRVFFVTLGPVLWRLPSGVRHIGYAGKLWWYMLRADVVLGFDTMTVGVPLVVACTLARKPYAIRIGGDFVWEQYVESTGDLVPLSRFYIDAKSRLSLKSRFEIWLTGMVVRRASLLFFNAAWLKDIWQPEYRFDPKRAVELENLYPPRQPLVAPQARVFVSAGRAIKLKQEPLLRRVIQTLKQKYPDIELDTSALPPREHAERVARSYAVVLASVSDVSPNVIIDAVAAGKPFVCTKDSGIRARLGELGLFVDTQNEAELSAAIESLLDPVVYQRLSARIQNFTFVRTWDNVADEVLARLQPLCAL